MKKLLYIIPISFAIYGLGHFIATKEYTPPYVAPGHWLTKSTTDQKFSIVQWPAQFSPILQQTGEINSPMTMKLVGDTLKIEFDQQ